MSGTMAAPDEAVPFDVVVVGAGLAGLACCDALLQAAAAPSGAPPGVAPAGAGAATSGGNTSGGDPGGASPAPPTPKLRVLVLEATRAAGGRTRTVPLESLLGGGAEGEGEGGPRPPRGAAPLPEARLPAAGPNGAAAAVDVGGMWLGTRHTRALALAERLGVRTFPQYLRGKHAYVDEQGQRRTYAGAEPVPLPLATLVDTYVNVVRPLRRLVEEVDPRDPRAHPRARELDAESVHSYFAKRVWTRGALATVGDFARGWAGAEPQAVSMLFTVQALKSGGGFDYCMDAEGGAQELRIRGGAQQLSGKLLAELVEERGVEVRFESKVVAVRRVAAAGGGGGGPGASLLAVRTQDGAEYLARAVVCAANVGNFVRETEFTPRLPHALEQLGRRAYPANYGKAVLVYSRAWWREAGLSGQGLVSRPGSLISSTFDFCSADGEEEGARLTALVGFFAGDGAVRAAELSPAERKERVLAEMERLFPEGGARSVRGELVAYHDKLWNLDPVAKGCSSLLMPPGCVDYSAGVVLAQQPVRLGGDAPVFFTGTDCAAEFVGYMEGALRHGESVGRQVWAALGSGGGW